MKAPMKATVLLISALMVLGTFGLASGQDVWVNMDEWEELSPDLQLIVYDAVATVGWDYFCESIVRDDEALVQYIDYGTKVEELPQAVVDAYLDAAMAFYDVKSAADPFYKEILDDHWEFKALCDRAGIK